MDCKRQDSKISTFDGRGGEKTDDLAKLIIVVGSGMCEDARWEDEEDNGLEKVEQDEERNQLVTENQSFRVDGKKRIDGQETEQDQRGAGSHR